MNMFAHVYAQKVLIVPAPSVLGLLGQAMVCLTVCHCNDASGENGAEAECREAGHYESGKEGSYLPCCNGLTEVFQLKAGYDGDGNPVCDDPPLRVYACVEGECGDGVCEVGEDKPCGCAEDCPGAVWEADAGE